MISVEEFRDLVPGSRVKIVNGWLPSRECRQNLEGHMDMWLGKIMTVHINDGYCVRMEEDNRRWVWNRFCIDFVLEEDEDIGDFSVQDAL